MPSRTRRRPTVRLIARLSGVSPTTVAHALNDTPGTSVARRTRQRVRRLAESLGYHRSLMARSIKHPLRHLGLAMGDKEPYQVAFAAKIFDGICDAARHRGYFPVVHTLSTQLADDCMQRGIGTMKRLHESRLIDGFIVDKPSFYAKGLAHLHERGVPVVTVNGSPVRSAEGYVPSITIDNFAAADLATQHVLDLGHRRIGLILRPFGIFPRGQRSAQINRLVQGYGATIARAGIEHDESLIVHGDPMSKADTYAAVDQLMALGDAPTAIFAADDEVAVMTVNALTHHHDRRVPRDVSVVGLGGWSPAGRLCEPTLTTVFTPLQENGRLATEMLIALIEGQTPPTAPSVLQPRLLDGQTTAPRQ